MLLVGQGGMQSSSPLQVGIHIEPENWQKLPMCANLAAVRDAELEGAGAGSVNQ